MPTCKSCGEKWSWKQTFKGSFTLEPSFQCPFCEKKQYQTKKSKRKCAILPFVAPFTFATLSFLGASLFTVVGVGIGVIILFLTIYPALIDLSNQEEHLF